jgi:hypothetical protein
MALRCFLISLFENGRVEVDEPSAPLEEHSREADEVLISLDRLARDELAFTPPELMLDVARWAAELIYRGCQLLVYRQLDAQTAKQWLSAACPRPLSAGTIYSADLTLRYLADLLTLARAVAEQDVLVAELLRIAAAWPLSSVGIAQVAANQLDPRGVEFIMADRSLRQLYVDRIIARQDRGRCEHAAVSEGVREAIGMYDELFSL